MAKFYGIVGFETTVEVELGIWESQIIEKPYKGDVIRLSRKSQSAAKINDDITISSEISILADDFANKNLYTIKYVEYAGAKWKVETATPQFPRIIFGLGGLYNENTN